MKKNLDTLYILDDTRFKYELILYVIVYEIITFHISHISKVLLDAVSLVLCDVYPANTIMK